MRHSTSDRPDLRVLHLDAYYGAGLLHHTVVALCPFLFWLIFDPLSNSSEEGFRAVVDHANNYWTGPNLVPLSSSVVVGGRTINGVIGSEWKNQVHQ